MQDPNADTEWNDILRKKGILPSKESLNEVEKEAEEEDEQRVLQQSIGEIACILCSLSVWVGNTFYASNCSGGRILWARVGQPRFGVLHRTLWDRGQVAESPSLQLSGPQNEGTSKAPPSPQFFVCVR